jgi:molybdopterin-guanine dinucleotide biosynthesis protein A
VVGLWPVALADDLAAALADGMRKIESWTARHGCAAATFADQPFDPFFNINTPEDLETAERIAAGRAVTRTSPAPRQQDKPRS